MTGFGDQIGTFSAKAQEKIDLITSRTIEELGKTLISFTHVLSGTLIANYNYSTEAPDIAVTTATATKETAKINHIEDIPKKAAGFIHYIATGVPYAGYAEFGTVRVANVNGSLVRFVGIYRSAPHRMFGLTTQGFQATVDRVVKEVAG